MEAKAITSQKEVIKEIESALNIVTSKETIKMLEKAKQEALITLTTLIQINQ